MRCFVLATLLALAAAPAAAQEVDCQNAEAQQDMNICAAQDYDAADAELNRVWKDAVARARVVDADQEGNLKGAEQALKAGQRGWIAYRDGQCTLAGFEARGGSMEPMLVSNCLAGLTRARTKELADFVEGSEP